MDEPGPIEIDHATGVTLDSSEPCRASFHARIAVWVFASFLVLYVGVTRGHFNSTDEIQVYEAARSLWEDLVPSVDWSGKVPGRGGRFYSIVNSGQPVASLPLYGLGKGLHHILDAADRPDWVRTFAGRPIRNGANCWGGEIEMFFVNLLNSFITALLCALFYAFNIRLGVGTKIALSCTALLGLTSYIAPFSTCYFQHSSEALFQLWAFYLLFVDSRKPDWKLRAYAGLMVVLLLQFRYPAAIAVPGLLAYHLTVIYRRTSTDVSTRARRRAIASESLPFVSFIALGFILHAIDQYWKFGTVFLTGGYAEAHYHTPLAKGVYAFLFSSGDSVFLYTPLLVLAPWLLRRFHDRFPYETGFIIFQFVFYLLIFSKFDSWHGMWCFGPRYLAATVPLLLLPLGFWLQHRSRRTWLRIAPLAAAGLWMQVIHVAVNFWSVALKEKYLEFVPQHGFLFIPDSSPLLAHSRALLAGDWCVDMWLVDVYRTFGLSRFSVVFLPLVSALLFCLWRLRRAVGRREQSGLSDTELRVFAFNGRRVTAVVASLVIATALAIFANHEMPGKKGIPEVSATEEIQAYLKMSYKHYQAKEFGKSIAAAMEVLKLNPNSDAAYSNITAAFCELGKWDDAILAGERAVKINPQNRLAQGNLEWARTGKQRESAPGEQTGL